MWVERGSRDNVCRDSPTLKSSLSSHTETECLSKQPPDEVQRDTGVRNPGPTYRKMRGPGILNCTSYEEWRREQAQGLGPGEDRVGLGTDVEMLSINIGKAVL